MTGKEKFIKWLKDWKTYVFRIPLLLIIIVAFILTLTKSDKNYSYLMMCLAVCAYAYVLGKITDIIAMFKRKTKRTTIFATILLVLMIAFIVFTAFCFADIIKVGGMEAQCEILHQEYLQVEPVDTELAEQKYNAWRTALEETHEMIFSVMMRITGALLTYSFSVIVVDCVDKKDEENKTDDVSPPIKT